MKKSYFLLTAISILFANIIAAQCTVNFSSSQVPNTLTVNFTNLSSHPPGMVMNYHWWFGDGNASSTQANATHTYSQAGTYLGYFSMWDSLNTCWDSTGFYITVNPVNPTCPVSFTHQNVGNNTVNFAASANMTTRSDLWWSFGDGNYNYNNNLNPSHTYNASGIYTVQLSFYDSIANCFASYTDSILVGICHAGFTITTNQNTVSLTNSVASQNYTSMMYDFGDGNTSSAINPTHTYNQTGTYTITQTVYNTPTNCVGTFSWTQTISSTNCSASFSVLKDTSTSFGVILVNTSTTGAGHDYFWDFGDGTTTFGRTPTHQYGSFGSYNVCLTVTDSILNCSTTFCDTVGMDSNGTLKSLGFGLRVVDPVITGVNEIQEKASLNLYPNPTADQLFIELPNENNNAQIRLRDLNGKLILNSNYNSNGNSIRIDVSDLNGGLYLLEVESGNEIFKEKFIKK